MTEGPRLRVTVSPVTIAVASGLATVAVVLFAPLIMQTAVLAGWVVGIVTYVAVSAARVRR